MPTPRPAPPAVDAPAATPSLRTLGTGAQQAASGADSRLSFATAVTSGILSATTQGIGGAKTFQGAATPVTVSGNDASGTAATMVVTNPGTGSGFSQIAMAIAGVEMGSIFGEDSAHDGLVDGLTVSAVTGKGIGFRVGTTGVGSVNATKWTIPQELHVTTTGVRFPDGSLQATAAGGSQWIQTGSNLNYAAGNVGIGASSVPTALLHLFSAASALANPFIKMADTTDTPGLIQFSDGTNTAAHFMPTMTATAVGSTADLARGFQMLLEPGADGASNAALAIVGRVAGAAMTASPLLQVFNHTTQALKLTFDGKLGLTTTTPTAFLEVVALSRNNTAPLFQLLDSEAAAAFFKVYDVANTISEWQPLLHVKGEGAGTGKAGFTIWAEPTQQNAANPAFVLDGRFGGAALTDGPIAEFRNFGTLRSKLSHNGEQFWTVKIQAGAEIGQASIGYAGSALGLNFQDETGNSRSDLRLLAGGGLTFHTSTGNGAPPEVGRWDSAGLLGIGVTPTRTLHVKTTTNNDATIITHSTGTTGFGGIGFLDEGGTRDFSFGMGGSAVTTVGGDAISADVRGTVAMILHNNTAFRVYGRASESGTGQLEQLEVLGTTGDWNWYQGTLFIDRSQSFVGIACGDNVAPAQRLEVNGNILHRANAQWLGRGTNDFISFDDTTTPSGANASSVGVSIWNSRGNVVVNIDSNNDTSGVNQARFSIFANKATNVMSGSLFNVQEDGAVGIGTDAPTEKFQVAGVIHSTVGGFKFPDNSVQLAAFVPSFGELYENNDPTGSSITVTTAGTYYQWVTTTVGQETGSGYVVGSATSDNMTIGASGAGKYQISFSVTLSCNTGANVDACVHVAGAASNLISSTKVGNTNDQHAISGTAIVVLAASDTVDLRFTSDTNGDVVKVYHVHLVINRIG